MFGNSVRRGARPSCHRVSSSPEQSRRRTYPTRIESPTYRNSKDPCCLFSFNYCYFRRRVVRVEQLVELLVGEVHLELLPILLVIKYLCGEIHNAHLNRSQVHFFLLLLVIER